MGLKVTQIGNPCITHKDTEEHSIAGVEGEGGEHYRAKDQVSKTASFPTKQIYFYDP